MARSLHVRLDGSSDIALAEEVARLMVDEGDRDEMRVIREQMAALAPDPAE
jgi:hypothetical protein